MHDCIACGLRITAAHGDPLYCGRCLAEGRRRHRRRQVASVVMLTVLGALVGVVLLVRPAQVETRYGPMVEAASRRVILEPDDVGAHADLVEALLERRAYSPAIEAASTLIALNEDAPTAWILRAHAHIGRSDYPKAINDLEEALSLQRTPDGEVLSTLGLCYAAIGAWPAARESYLAALAVSPESPSLQEATAEACEAVGAYAEAAAHLERALRLAPLAPDASQRRRRLSLLRSEAGLPHTHVPGVDPVDVPLMRWSNILVAEVTLNEEVPAHLVFDTGASFTTVTSSVATALGYDERDVHGTIDAVSAAGPVVLPLIRLESVAVGELVLYDLEVGICDACGMGGLDGLLGLNFTEHFITELDVQRQVLRLTPRRTLTTFAGGPLPR